MASVLLSCEGNDELNLEPSFCLKSVSFELKENEDKLVDDIKCNIVGDSLIECWIPYLLDDKLLKPTVTFDALECIIDSLPYKKGETLVNFRRPVRLQLRSNKASKEYLMLVHSFTGLPVVRIQTKDNVEIISKKNYVEASISIQEDIINDNLKGIEDTPVLIRGRGHSTWKYFPKKPYRIKFDNKVEFLDMPKDKSWVLLANYKDNTLLRNHIAYWLGSISNLEYTPRFQFVECILNGNYNGIYQLGENLKISKHRLNIGDEGFLLEMASNEDGSEPYFTTKHLQPPFYFKDPDVVVGDDNYCYARDFLNEAENVLYSEIFLDPAEGWRKYFDETSLVDYYLISEITKNVDAVRWTSTYVNFVRGGKIKMGPLWDYDSAFGNETYDNCDKPEDFYTKLFGWYPQLFKDPSFVDAVKKRFDFFYRKKANLMSEIDQTARFLTKSAYEDNVVWGILDIDKRGEFDHRHFQGGGYDKEVEWLKDWICIRLDWLKIQFDNM